MLQNEFGGVSSSNNKEGGFQKVPGYVRSPDKQKNQRLIGGDSDYDDEHIPEEESLYNKPKAFG